VRAQSSVHLLIRPWLTIACLSTSIPVACSPKQSGATVAPDACANECERNDWPRLILGVLDSGANVSVAVRTNGQEFAVTVGGCPVEFDTQRMLCSYSFSAAPSQALLTLAVTSDGVALPTHDVQLSTYNSCARSIAYVELSSDTDVYTWSETRFINPCSSIQ
jgi:hypothetical protein